MKTHQPNYLQKLDHYLLINHPVIWATCVHRAIIYIVILFSINLACVSIVPVNFSNVPDMENISVYAAVSTIIFFCIWLVSQKLTTYLALKGKITKLYFVKTLLVTYCIWFGISSAQVIPFVFLQNRYQRALIDKGLPALDFTRFSGALLSYQAAAKKQNKYPDPVSLDTSLNLSVYGKIRLVRTQEMSDIDIAKCVLTRGDNSLLSFCKIDRKNHTISFGFYEQSGDKFISKTLKTTLVPFSTKKFSSKLYKTVVTKKNYVIIDQSNKTYNFSVYCYRSPFKGLFVYTDSTDVHASLFIENSLENMPLDRKNNYADQLSHSIEKVGGSATNSLGIIAAGLLVCILIAFIMFQVMQLKAVAFGAAILSFFMIMGVTFFISKLLVYNLVVEYALTAVALISCIFIYYLSRLTYMNEKRVLLFSMLINLTLIIGIILVVTINDKIYQSFIEGGQFTVSQKDWFKCFALVFITGFLYPCFFMPAIYRVSLLPRE